MLTNVEEIKSRLDIVDVIQEYFPLKQAGVNFKANCPFHQEKTPSFMVSRERQMWHCFGCNEGGDMFEFIKKIENIDFPEALKILAAKAGVELRREDPKTTSLRTRIMNMNELAADWFATQLIHSTAGAKAKDYLQNIRGLNDDLIKYWQLGYALDSWNTLGEHLRSHGFKPEEIIQSGLVVPKSGGYEYYDRFRDRIMFPIVDHHGNIVGFTGRTMKADEQAKYVNTPQTPVYNKSEVIFGLYQAKQFIKEQNSVVIVEGNMDVIGSVKGGVKNVVAVSGTALTTAQIKILQRYTNNIIFSFDADAAGIRAAERAIAIAWAAEANVRVAVVPRNLAKDPDELAQKNPIAWQQLVATAPLAMDYFFTLHLTDYQPDNVEHKKNIAKNILNLILKLESPIEQDFYLKKLSEELNINESSLRAVVYKAKNSVAPPKTTSAFSTPRQDIPLNKKSAVATRLLSFMLLDRDYAVYVSEHLLPESLPQDWLSVYKLLIIYYTKQASNESLPPDPIDFIAAKEPGLTILANSLIIKKEELRALSYAEAVHEIQQHLDYLKKSLTQSRQLILKEELRQAEHSLTLAASAEEQDALHSEIQSILGRLNKLSAELKDTDF
ncbi:MAG TPA: DNA primase [bacterium]|nr:DNA primase [bacterium]